MSLTMLQLGNYRFTLQTAAYQQLSHTHSFRWASQARLGQRPAQQYVGPGKEQMTLDGVIYPHCHGGMGQVSAMRQQASKGEPLVLVAGTGDVWGQWVIEQIVETWSHCDRQGLPKKIGFRVQLTRYGEDT